MPTMWALRPLRHQFWLLLLTIRLCRSRLHRITTCTNRHLHRAMRLLTINSSNNNSNSNAASRGRDRSSRAPNVERENCDAIAFVHALNAKNRTEPANMLSITIPQTSPMALTVKCQNLLDQQSVTAVPPCLPLALLFPTTTRRTGRFATGILQMRHRWKSWRCAWRGWRDTLWREALSPPRPVAD